MHFIHFTKFRPIFFVLMLLVAVVWTMPAKSEDVDKVEEGSGSDKKEGVTVIVDLAGKVEMIESEGAKPKPAVKGVRVPVGATFVTGADGRLDLALSNGAMFQIRENSRFTIGEFEQDAYEFVFSNGAAIRPREIKEFGADEAVLQTMDASEEAWNKLGSEPTSSKGKFLLSKGTMIGQSKKLKSNSRMEIVTPVGSAYIRGTVWMLTVSPVEGAGGGRFQARLDVAEGRVDFGSSNNSRNVQVQAGFATTIEASVSPGGEARVNAMNTVPMSAERQAMLLGTVSTIAQQQTYFTAVNGNPDTLREAMRAQGQGQAQGEGNNQQADGDFTDANPNQIGISDLPPVIPTTPTQPPPPPAPTPAPTPGSSPVPKPSLPEATPPPTPTPNPSNG